MDFALSEDQLALRESIRRAPIDAGRDTLAEDEHGGKFSWAGWRRFSELGYPALPLPVDLGGAGADLLTTLVAIEALGYRCPDSGLVHALVTQILCGLQIVAYGTEEQKQAYVPRIASGEIVCAQALTEPDAGSDVAAMKTRAEKAGDDYVLDGAKTFISNGPIADLVIVYASTGAGRRALGGLTCFLVDAATPGLSRSKPFEKMGLRTLQNGEIVLEGCRVPAARRLGFEGQAMLAFGQVMEWERCLLFGAHIGTLERVIEQCVRYARERSQFGSPIGRFQSVSHKIANMKVSLELGRLMLYKTAWLKDHGHRVSMETAIGKLFVSESLQRACLDAVQIHGAYGYAKEYELERDLRDSIACTIYSGTSEIQRNVIASFLGL